MAWRRVLRVADLSESDPGHALPRVGDVAGRAPGIAYDPVLRPPFPHVAPPVLTERVDDVARHLIQRRSAHLVRSLEHGELLIGLARREHTRVAAPIVLEVVDAPARERAKILKLVLPARLESLTRRWPRPGV